MPAQNPKHFSDKKITTAIARGIHSIKIKR
jgi:hypothetical protein